MSQLEALKKKFNIQTRGTGMKPIIFVHGFGCDQSMWRFLTPKFEADHFVVLYDQIGAGSSDISLFDKNKYSTLNGYALDLIEIIEGLNLKDVIFVGHSVSAMTGIIAAINKKNLFSKLILIGPSPCYFKDGTYDGGFERQALEELLSQADANYLSWAKAMAPAIMSRSDRPELGEELTNSFCKTNPEIAKHFARVLFLADNRKDLLKLEVQSLIIQCSQDIVAPEQVGRFMHDKIKNSHFEQLNAVGHCPHVSEPEETFDVIKKFLNL